MTFNELTRVMLSSMDFFELRRTAARYGVPFQGVRRSKLLRDLEKKITSKNTGGGGKIEEPSKSAKNSDALDDLDHDDADEEFAVEIDEEVEIKASVKVNAVRGGSIKNIAGKATSARKGAGVKINTHVGGNGFSRVYGNK